MDALLFLLGTPSRYETRPGLQDTDVSLAPHPAFLLLGTGKVHTAHLRLLSFARMLITPLLILQRLYRDLIVQPHSPGIHRLELGMAIH
jgi:hypothetical protein